MGFYIETVQTTRCGECNKPLAGPNDWALHRRNHSVERLLSTEEGRRTYEGLIQCGFKDEPDKELYEAAQRERRELGI